MTIETQQFNGTCFRLINDPLKKPLIVMIHGVGLNQDLWLPWIDVLKADYSVLTYDFLGHGGSHNPPGERCIDDYLFQLENLVNHFGVTSFCLVGFSMGALIGQAFASSRPARLNHLVLLHSVYQRTDEQCEGVRKRYEITKQEGPMSTVELAINRWFSPTYIEENPNQMDEIRKIFAKHTDDGYLKAYGFFANAESTMKHYPVRKVGCPCLIMTGQDDVGSTPAMSSALARDLPNAELVINEGHRHGAPYEFAEKMARKLQSFLAKTTDL